MQLGCGPSISSGTVMTEASEEFLVWEIALPVASARRPFRALATFLPLVSAVIRSGARHAQPY